MNIADIKQRVDIVDVVSNAGVELRRAGNRLVGLCPLHSEQNPSFHVFTNSQKFKCYGCGKYGDAIDFIKELNNCDFKQVLKILNIEPTKITEKERLRIENRQHKRKLVAQFREWEKLKIDELSTLVRCCHRVIKGITNLDSMDEIGCIYHGLVIWEYQLNEIMLQKNDREKFNYYLMEKKKNEIQQRR